MAGKHGAGKELHKLEVREKKLLAQNPRLHLANSTANRWDLATNPAPRPISQSSGTTVKSSPEQLPWKHGKKPYGAKHQGHPYEC